MQCCACVEHTELYFKPLKHSELSPDRPPTGQNAAQYMVVSAVNLLPLSPLPTRSIVSGLTAAYIGLSVGSSTVKYQSAHPLTLKSNALFLESAAGSLESRATFTTSHTRTTEQTKAGRRSVEVEEGKVKKAQEFLRKKWTEQCPFKCTKKELL